MWNKQLSVLQSFWIELVGATWPFCVQKILKGPTFFLFFLTFLWFYSWGWLKYVFLFISFVYYWHWGVFKLLTFSKFYWMQGVGIPQLVLKLIFKTLPCNINDKTSYYYPCKEILSENKESIKFISYAITLWQLWPLTLPIRGERYVSHFNTH